MNASLLHRFDRAQFLLLRSAMPSTPVRLYEVPDIDQAKLLARIERERLQRAGGK